MTATEWLVTIGGAGAIAWVNWYFFLAQRANRTSIGVESAPEEDQ